MFYETVDMLKSCYHMSERQATSAVVTVGNKMFGRAWKPHDEPAAVDLDTLPESSNVRHAGKSIEALALDEIVKEIMERSEQVVVTYSDDGSRKQGAGSLSVQGITVNGKYRSLPTMTIASESRKNLAALKVAVLEILEAASGEQALDCTTWLINHDFDHKPWNKAGEFDLHISPKPNKSVSLKDERFSWLTLTCAICLYHLDDVASFLQKYEHVTNQLACIIRCFLDLDFLKVMYCAGALIGLHLIEPYLFLTTSSETTYSKIIPIFSTLYKELLETDPVTLLNADEPAFKFVSSDGFKHTRYSMTRTSVNLLLKWLPPSNPGDQASEDDPAEAGCWIPETER